MSSAGRTPRGGELPNVACNWFSSGRARQKAKADPPISPPPPEPQPEPVTPAPIPSGPTDPTPPIRVTNEQDGVLLNRGYSYWSQAFVLNEDVYAFVGSDAGRPLFFKVNIASGTVTRLGSLLPYAGTGEGWYWNAIGRVIHPEGSRLMSSNPFSPEETVIFDIAGTHPGCRLWQAHSSDYGVAHSATVQQIVESGPYPPIGTVAFRNDEQQYFAADTYNLDESQVTADGRYLLIKSSPDDDNLFVDLETGKPWPWITKADGALGHSDSGRGYMIGADRARGACVRVDLPSLQRTELFPTWNLGHVAVRGDRILVSDAVNINLFSDGQLRPICAHGMVNPYPPEDPRSYDDQVFGNISHDESTVAFVSNKEGRMDLYIKIL